MRRLTFLLVILVATPVLLFIAYVYYHDSSGWRVHVVHSGDCCTDGTRLADFDRDGEVDIVTSVEESGGILLLFSEKTGHQSVHIGVGEIRRSEDALAVDFNGDGFPDIFSSQENRSFKHTVCMNPGNKKAARLAASWKCRTVPVSENLRSWLIAEVLASSRDATSLVVGGKTRNNGQPGSVSLLSGTNTKDGEIRWSLTTLDEDAEWIMSINVKDITGDGLDDIIYVDRRGKTAGVKWLEQSPGSTNTWKRHVVSTGVSEAMYGGFFNGLLVAIEHTDSWYLTAYSLPHGEIKWRHELPRGYCKPRSFAIADFKMIGTDQAAILCSTTRYQFPRIYSVDLSNPDLPPETIANTPGSWFSKSKYDAAHAMDMDGDGDIDILTDEEAFDNKGLGVVWYENPLR